MPQRGRHGLPHPHGWTEYGLTNVGVGGMDNSVSGEPSTGGSLDLDRTAGSRGPRIDMSDEPMAGPELERPVTDAPRRQRLRWRVLVVLATGS